MLFRSMLEAVGFDVELDLVQNVADQTQKIYIDKDFDIATAAISVHEEGVYSRIATALGTGSPTNGGGYSSPEMDALIQELQGKKTPEDATDVLTRIEAPYATDVPALPIRSATTDATRQKNDPRT